MKYLIFFFGILIGSILFVSCNRAQGSHVTKEESLIPDSLIQRVETAAATMQDVSDELKLNGKVVPNESRQAKLYALVSGKISNATKELGEYVQKGQTLAVLRSTEVAGMTHDISLAETNVAIAKKNLESIEDLYKGDLATEKELIQARLEYNKTVSELKKAKQVSAITGGKSASYVLSAPIGGFIIEKNITNNSEVRQDNDTPLFTIADLSTVWVMADVYERDINNIHIGDEVRVHTLSNTEKAYTGKIDRIYNVLNPSTRTMQVRINMNNAAYDLKPGMYATVKVKSKTTQAMLAIPHRALVFENGNQYVVVKKDNSTVERRAIQMVKKIGDTAFVQGLEEGEQVVTRSQLFLFEALNSK